MKPLDYKAVIRQPEILNSLGRESLDQLISTYPYFATARIFLAKQQIDQGKPGDAMLSKAAIYTADRSRLKDWVTGVDLLINDPEVPKPAARTSPPEQPPAKPNTEEAKSASIEAPIPAEMKPIETSVEEVAVEEIVVENAAVESTPADLAPVDSTPADSTPAESAPVDPTPAEEPPVETASEIDEASMQERKDRMAAIRAEQAKILGVTISLPLKAPEISESARDTDDTWERGDMQLKHKPEVVQDILQKKEEEEERLRLEEQLAAEHLAKMEAMAAEQSSIAASNEVVEADLPAVDSKLELQPVETEMPEAEPTDSAASVQPPPPKPTQSPQSPESPQSTEAEQFDIAEPHDFTTWLRFYSQKEVEQAGAVESPTTTVEEVTGAVDAIAETPVEQPKPTPETSGSDDLGRFSSLIAAQRDKARAQQQQSSADAAEAKETIADWVVSETYALLLEKQGKSEKAIQVYEKLRLLYPEKSSFFASRIKALEAEI